MNYTEETVAGVDVKQAVQLAKEFARTVFEPEQVQGLGLEAVERTDDGQHWLVTLGFYRPPAPKSSRRNLPSPLEEILPTSDLKREYKVFKVDAGSGEVLGMQIFKN